MKYTTNTQKEPTHSKKIKHILNPIPNKFIILSYITLLIILIAVITSVAVFVFKGPNFFH